MVSLAAVPAEAVAVAGKSSASRNRRAKHGNQLSVKGWCILGGIVVLIAAAVWGIIMLNQANGFTRANYTAVRDAITVRLTLSDDGLKMKAHVEETLEVEFAPDNKGNVIERDYREYRPPLPVKTSAVVRDEQGNSVPVRVHEVKTSRTRGGGKSELRSELYIGDQRNKVPLQGKKTYHISYDVGDSLLGNFGNFSYTLPLPKPEVETRQLTADIIFPDAQFDRDSAFQKAKLQPDRLTCNRFTGKGEKKLGPCDVAEIRGDGKSIHIEQANLKQEFVWLGISAPETQAQYNHSADKQEESNHFGIIFSVASVVIIFGLIWWTRKQVAKEKANKDKSSEKPSEARKKRRVARKGKPDA